MMSPFDLWWERNMPAWWAGWPTWFRARRRELRERWFWLVTLRDYGGAPPSQNKRQIDADSALPLPAGSVAAGSAGLNVPTLHLAVAILGFSLGG